MPNPKILVLLLALIPAATACDNRLAQSSGDAGPQPDGRIADGPAPPDASRPRPDSLAPAAVTVTTDRSQYGVLDVAKVTAHNGLSQDIWLAGCTIFSRELQQADGSWLDKGADEICDWEGYAAPLVAGASSVALELRFGTPGTWRISLLYGIDCDPKKPLAAKNCARLESAFSAAVKVSTTAKNCDALSTQYKKALNSSLSCSSAATAPQCTKLVSSDIHCGCSLYVGSDIELDYLRTRFVDLGCPKIVGPCGIKCASPIPSACLNDRCVPMGD